MLAGEGCFCHSFPKSREESDPSHCPLLPPSGNPPQTFILLSDRIFPHVTFTIGNNYMWKLLNISEETLSFIFFFYF